MDVLLGDADTNPHPPSKEKWTRLEQLSGWLTITKAYIDSVEYNQQRITNEEALQHERREQKQQEKLR